MANPPARDIIFYDGECGLCHGVVKWVMARDAEGRMFDFSPLQGETFAARVPAAQRAGLPDSVVVRTREGGLLTRSDASLYILEQLGGRGRRQARGLRLAPRALRDLLYRVVARLRKLLAKPVNVCPVMTEAQRSRFLP